VSKLGSCQIEVCVHQLKFQFELELEFQDTVKFLFNFCFKFHKFCSFRWRFSLIFPWIWYVLFCLWKQASVIPSPNSYQANWVNLTWTRYMQSNSNTQNLDNSMKCYRFSPLFYLIFLNKRYRNYIWWTKWPKKQAYDTNPRWVASLTWKYQRRHPHSVGGFPSLWNEAATQTSPPQKLPRNARVTLGTTYKNKIRGIASGIRLLWGIQSSLAGSHDI